MSHKYYRSMKVTGALALALRFIAASVPAYAAEDEPWPHVAPAYSDTEIEERVAHILSRMTLEAKVGQIIQADINRVTPDEVRRYRLGSVLNGANSGPGKDDKAPPSAWLALADRFYAASMDVPPGEPAIPVFWGIDAVHGHSNIIGATIFPHNIGLGAANDSELIRRIGAITAEEISVTGQDWDFSPAVSVARDDRWGRTYESYSEDPEIVRTYAAAMVEGLQGKVGSPGFLKDGHVIATAKHFIGDGGTTDGINEGDTAADAHALRIIHGAGYESAIAAGVQSVMASHSSVNGVRMHGNRALLTNVLRGELGFDGLTVGDWNGHSRVPGCTTTDCPAAINAGLDMYMAPDSWRELYASILSEVKSGAIPQARLDEAVRRILRVKMRAGMFEKGAPSARAYGGRFDELGSPAHRAVAREAVRRSMVLLKNESSLLPLKRNLNVLVAGEGADSVPRQSGGWSISWQGTGVTNADFPHAETIFAGIRNAVAGVGSAILSPDGTYSSRPDVAVVVFGEDPYAESMGDRPTLEFSPGDKHDLTLLKKLKAAGIPVVSVFLSGRPLWVNPEINASDAFVAAFLPGGEGGGVADVLFRDAKGRIGYDFTGKLSFSWPRRADQYQLNRGDARYDPLFPYGYGLTYAHSRHLGKLDETLPSRRTSDLALFPQAEGTQQSLVEGARASVLAGNRGESPGGQLRVTAFDRLHQEDARNLKWSAGKSAALRVQLAQPLSAYGLGGSDVALSFAYRVNAAPQSDVTLLVRCGEGCGASKSETAALREAPRQTWRVMEIPLRCFGLEPRRLDNITVPFEIETAGELDMDIADVKLARPSTQTTCS